MLKEKVLSTEGFFNIIFEGRKKVNFRCLKKGETTGEFYDIFENVDEKLQELNEQNYNIYFVVNSGGTMDEEIEKYNALFADFDISDEIEEEERMLQYKQELLKQGVDEKTSKQKVKNKAKKISNNLDLITRNKYKEKFREKLERFTKDFGFAPTLVVDTKNGLHVYWKLQNGTEVTQSEFKLAQQKIINYFDCDNSVKSPSNLLRVPGFYHVKDSKDKYMVTIFYYGGEVSYGIYEFINMLPRVENEEEYLPEEEEDNRVLLCNNSEIETVDQNIYRGNVNLIINGDVENLQKKVNPKPVNFRNWDEIYDYLRRQDLRRYLGLGNKTNCLFHDDKNPSSEIYRDDRKDEKHYWYYKCWSESCNILADIISITERLQSCSTSEAISFLCGVYKIDKMESEWQLKQKRILESNMQLITEEDKLDNSYPTLNSFIRRYFWELYHMHKIALENIVSDNYVDSAGNIAFFVTNARMSYECGKSDTRRTCDKINILTFLGLIKKLSDEEVPEGMLDKIKRYTSQLCKEKGINNSPHVNIYSIPYYSDELLAFAEEKAKQWHEYDFTVRGFSKQMIAEKLGYDEAARVFPQFRNKPLPQLSQRMSSFLEEVVMQNIHEKGYTTEKEVLDQVENHFKQEEFMYQKTQLKRSLPAILENNNLEKVKLNKELKENLGIGGESYFYVIVEKGLKNK